MKKIYASDYRILPNTTEDYTVQICKMIAQNSENCEIIFEHGNYYFKQENASKLFYVISNSDYTEYRSVSILIKNCKNLRFNANNSNFIFSGATIPFVIDHSESISISDLKIDWDIPSTAECIVTNVSDDFFDATINQELFPSFVENNILYFKFGSENVPFRPYCHCEFDYTTNKISNGGGDKVMPFKVEQISDNTFRMYVKKETMPALHNIIILRHTPRVHSGLFAECCKDLKFTNITFYHCCGLGMSMQFNENMLFNNINFIPNKARGVNIISGHDDGLHLSNNKGNITVQNCSFHGLMDDPINVHGTCVKLVEFIDEHTVKCRYMHNQAKGFLYWANSNDEISFINNKTMNSVYNAVVVSYNLISNEEFLLTLKDILPNNLEIGFAVENITNTPSFICKNNVFGSCRARGILLSTPKPVVIENNIFDSSGSAILVAGDSNGWYESGECNDVVIKNNVFTDACLSSMYQFCDAVISVYPIIPTPIKNLPFHKNIIIKENKFYLSDYPLLCAKSTDNLQFYDNYIYRSYSIKPWHPIKQMISLDYCSNVKISNNKYIGNILGMNLIYSGMNEDDINIINDNLKRKEL